MVGCGMTQVKQPLFKTAMTKTLPCTGSVESSGICRSTRGPKGFALRSDSEPDTDCLLFHAAAGHSFREMYQSTGFFAFAGKVTWQHAICSCSWEECLRPSLVPAVLSQVAFVGRLGGRKGLLCEAFLKQTPTACCFMQQLVTVSGRRINRQGSLLFLEKSLGSLRFVAVVGKSAWDPPLYRQCWVK